MNHVVFDNETSFWNATDQRVDSLFTELDVECKQKLVELINKGVSNYELTPEEFKKLEESELTEGDYPAPVVDLGIPQLRVVENDLVFRGNGITTTNGNNVITVNPPNGIRVYERPTNVNLTYDLDAILPQLEISPWVKDIASDLPNNTEPQNNE
jgi:hypothetical protein